MGMQQAQVSNEQCLLYLLQPVIKTLAHQPKGWMEKEKVIKETEKGLLEMEKNNSNWRTV